MVVAVSIEIDFHSPVEAHGVAQALSRLDLNLNSLTVDPVLGSRKTAFVLSCLLQIGVGVSTRVAGDAIYDAIRTVIQPSSTPPTQSPSASLAHAPVRLRIGQIETNFSPSSIADALERQLQRDPP